MVFTSIPFWIFALFGLALTFSLRQTWLYRPILMALSLFFYSSGEGAILWILLVSSGVDFIAGQWVGPHRQKWLRRIALTLSLTVNLGFLFFFKYRFTFVDHFLTWLGMGQSVGGWLKEQSLPLGISFYTFQSMSYTIDIYRGKLKPCASYFDFLTFVSFFPQLIAGPIERAAHLLPQIQDPKPLCGHSLRVALLYIMMGFFKKLFVADSIGTTVQMVFSDPLAHPWEWYLAGWMMTLRVYFDFSAYSDFALGLALLFGVELTENFRPIWFVTNPLELWNRWNITLGRWIRDYLLIPIGGNGRSRFAAARNMIIVFTAIGLWHGGSWNWILFGVVNGCLVALYRDLKKSHPRWVQATPGWLGFVVIQMAVLPLNGLLHQAGDPELWQGFFRCAKQSWLSFGGVETLLPHFAFYLLPGMALDIYREKVDFRAKMNLTTWTSVMAILAGFVLFITKGGKNESFIYFSF